MFAFLLPEIVIEVACMTAEAFCSRGSSVVSIAESAKLSPNRRAFEAIVNFSAQSYSTRSTVIGKVVRWKKGKGGSQNKTIVANLCERCMIGAVCHVKWHEVWAYRLRSPNGGGGDRPRPFIIIAIWAQAFCSLTIAEIPLQGLTSAVALVLHIHTGASELLAHDEWGGSSFPSGKAFSASRKWGGITAAGTIAVRLLRITNVCNLQSWGEPRLGAHTNLDRSRKECVYVKVGIIVAVTGEVFVSNREIDSAGAETRESKLGAALPC